MRKPRIRVGDKVTIIQPLTSWARPFFGQVGIVESPGEVLPNDTWYRITVSDPSMPEPITIPIPERYIRSARFKFRRPVSYYKMADESTKAQLKDDAWAKIHRRLKIEFPDMESDTRERLSSRLLEISLED